MIGVDDFFTEPKGYFWGLISIGVGIALILADLYYFVSYYGMVGPMVAAGFLCIGYGIADCVPSDRERTIGIVRASSWGLSLGIWSSWSVAVLL